MVESVTQKISGWLNRTQFYTSAFLKPKKCEKNDNLIFQLFTSISNILVFENTKADLR